VRTSPPRGDDYVILQGCVEFRGK